jgi:dienelactone hydrolase
MRPLAMVLFLTTLAAFVRADDDPTKVFTDSQRKRKMLDAYFQRMSRPKPPTFTSKEDWEKRKQELRPLVLQDLGLAPLPERVPLDARVVATKEYDDYRLERIWFRTLPKVWASGWLYIPKGVQGKKHPAILNPHGHWNEGARHPVVQSRCIALAKKGFVALAVDSVHVTHWPLGVCSVGMMTWNNMRALDYLESRPDVDATKLGCTGESGGGQQTMYLMALDDRIQAAVPAVLVSYFHRILFATEETHCFCNHVPFLLRHTDAPELVALFAPKPALYISVTGDWTAQFPKEEYPHIQAVYAGLGHKDNVASRHYASGHDYSKPMREAMYAWFNKWLKGIEDPQAAKEPEIKTESPEMLRRMDKPPADNRGEAGIIEYYRERRMFAEPVLSTSWDWKVYQRIYTRNFGFLLYPDAGQSMTYMWQKEITKEKHGSYRFDKITYTGGMGLDIPALLFRPQREAAKMPVVIVLAAEGKACLLTKHKEFLDDLLQRGFLVFAPDVSFRGELQIHWDLNTIIWGLPEAGLAARDVHRAVDVLEGCPDVDRKRIFCVGLGEMGVPALLSGIYRKQLSAVAADDFGTTYRQGREKPLLPQLLRYGDLPQVAALYAPKPLWLNRATPKEQYDFTRKAYTAFADLNGPTALQLPELEPAAARKTIAVWLSELATKDK